MDARFYNSEELDIQQLANDLENAYRAQGYQIQQFGNKDQMLIQLKKGGDFETLIGMGVALSLNIQRTSGGVMALIGQQKWMDKAAAGAVGAVGLVFFPLLPLAVTAGVGAIRQMSLANQILNMVDGLVRQQRPGVIAGPIPAQLLPQFQQQYLPPAYTPPAYTPPIPQPPPVQYLPSPQPIPQPPPAQTPSQLRCPTCNTPYDPSDEFCSGCGKSLIATKTLCPHCNTELKTPDASFCPRCGASIFQTLSATQAAIPAPPQQQPPTITYTPSPPQASPPKPAAPPQPEQYYIPSVPQDPPVVPQPKVTFIPAAPQQQAPPAPKQSPTPLYTPPPAKPAAPPPPKPIVAKPAAEPAFDPNVTWGYLTFSDSQPIKLTGERAVIGRYDHDLGGINPEVDLAAMQNAETVSRIHASIEHIGSTYTLTDLNSTNATRINGKHLEPDKPTPINDGDTLQFGKLTCTFTKA